MGTAPSAHADVLCLNSSGTFVSCPPSAPGTVARHAPATTPPAAAGAPHPSPVVKPAAPTRYRTISSISLQGPVVLAAVAFLAVDLVALAVVVVLRRRPRRGALRVAVAPSA